MILQKINKKGEMINLIRIILWLAFFIIGGIATYFLIKFIRGLG